MAKGKGADLAARVAKNGEGWKIFVRCGVTEFYEPERETELGGERRDGAGKVGRLERVHERVDKAGAGGQLARRL